MKFTKQNVDVYWQVREDSKGKNKLKDNSTGLRMKIE